MTNSDEFRHAVSAAVNKYKPRSILVAYSFAEPVDEKTDNLDEGVLVDGDLENLARTMHLAIQKSVKLFVVINGILKKMGGTL